MSANLRISPMGIVKIGDVVDLPFHEPLFMSSIAFCFGVVVLTRAVGNYINTYYSRRTSTLINESLVE
jgi:hypothetical protein